ncbi:hypothetical protein BLNAU_9882 [Blattamonas nauphoetae]|uniref:Uncharacterized protein n=1 Tax=Blattamonas nauphoetae TaxID=2049346 RepID=A0ABQ9XUJ4_9EUKA|nr:hypothetical protein BLNAU_9882 [Blattamonas nauphoetae]
MGQIVSGTLLVLVSNGRGTRTPSDGSAPNIGRLVVFSLNSASEGTIPVSTGEQGLLQHDLEEYTILAASLPDRDVSFPSGPIPVVYLPELLSASCDLDESRTKAVLHLSGTDLEDGEYILTLNDSSTVAVNFATDPEWMSTGTVTLGEIGRDSKWKEGIIFAVSNLNKQNQKYKPLIDGDVIFTIPSVAHLISISVEEVSEASKTDVTLSFVSSRLEKNSQYTLGVVVDAQGTNSEVISIGVSTDGDGKIVDKTLSLFPFAEDEDERKKQLEFGVKYQVEWLRLSSFTDSVVIDSVVFEMPSERVRVSGASCSADHSSSTVVSITGSGFVIGETYTITVSGTPTDAPAAPAHIAEIRVHGTTDDKAASSSIPLSSASEEGSLRYDYSYTVTGITNGSLDGFVIDGVFVVPAAGIVSSTSTELNSETNEEFKVIVSGKNFVIDSEWILKLTGRSEEISVTMTSTEKGESSWVKAGGPNGIEFLKSYAVSTITLKSNASEHLVCSGVPLTTPPGPTLTHIKAELNPSNLNESTVSVTVSPCAAGSFTLIVFDESDDLKKEISIGPISFTSSPTQTSSYTVVIHPSGKLSYGKTYTVKALSSSTLIVSHASPTFDIPAAPPRISYAAATLTGTNKTWVDVVLTGEALPQGKGFTIVVKEMEGDVIKSGAAELYLTGTIEGSIGTTTTCTASVEIYNQSNTLEYSQKYKIESLVIVGYGCIVDSTAEFEIPDSPGRVEGTEEPDLNGMKTTVTVKVKGVNFPSTVTSMKVKGESAQITSTSITDISRTELTAIFDANSEESGTALGFEKSYSIVEISGGSEVFVNSGVGFTVPTPGIVSSTSTELNPATNEHFKAIVSGKNFGSGTEWILKLTGRNEEIEVTMSSTEKGESSWVKAGGVGELQFDQSYTLLTMTLKSNSSEHLVCSGVSLTTPPKPAVSVLHISWTGNDENEGTATDPLQTLHTALRKCKAEQNEDWRVEISDWCRIGKQTEFGLEQEGLRVIVKGGEGRKIECTLTDSDQSVGQRKNMELGMVSVRKNTLSFVDLTFILTSSSERIGSVLKVGEGGVVWMERCEVSSSERINHRFVTVSEDGEMKGEGLKISSIHFGGKGSVVCLREEGRLTLSSCSFDGVSFASGGVVVGKTGGKIVINQTEFTRCSGRSLGSVIGVMTVGGEVIVSQCRFAECWTTVDLDEQGRVALGGGCVLIEMKEQRRSLSSCRVDLRESCFEGCSLTLKGKGHEDTKVIGGSGFMIVGRRVKGVVLLDGVQLSSCRCVGDARNVVFSGGLPLFGCRLTTPLFPIDCPPIVVLRPLFKQHSEQSSVTAAQTICLCSVQ